MMEGICTTGRRFRPENVRLAKEMAEELGIPYVPRDRESIEDLRKNYGCEHVLVAKRGLLILDTPGGEFFFIPIWPIFD